MSAYPVFLKLNCRPVVIIGGGAIATRKAQALLAAGAILRIVAKSFDNDLKIMCRDKNVELINSKYSKKHLNNAVLAIAATNDLQINRQIAKDCRQLKILCNVVDEPQLCDFYVPAVVKRGSLQVAISTDGLCPAYGRRLREKFDKIIQDKHNDFLLALEEVRKQSKKEFSDNEKRKVLMRRLVADKSFKYFKVNGPAKWKNYAVGIIGKLNSQRKKPPLIN